jgi:hypothetical protein
VKNKHFLILFFVLSLGFLLWGWLGYQGYKKLLTIAEKYTQHAQSQDNMSIKNYYFSLAMAISPKDSTRKQYIEALLENADFNKAESELSKISESTEKTEYQTYLDASRGNYQSINRINQPTTELGKFLLAVKDDNYSNPGSSGLAKQIKPENYNNLRLSLAQLLFENHNYGLGRYILFKLNEKVALKETYTLIAQSFELEGNFTQALSWQLQLIAFDPSRNEYYEKAITFAKSANNQIQEDHLQKQLNELKKSQK